jgi:hypothetical protein
VKKASYGKVVILILCLIFLCSALAWAESREVVRVRGKVASLSVEMKTMRVNERAFVWKRHTLFYDETGSPMKPEGLKKNMKVSIEATVVPQGPFIIKALHILPK